MAKYLLRRGLTRLPIDGVREIPREGLPPLKQSATVVFEAGVAVDSDLDFGPWVEDGTLVRLRESSDPPRPPVPVPPPAVKREVLTPMPAFVQVEVVKEAAPEDPPAPPAPSEVVEPAPVAEQVTPVETPRPRIRRR